MSDPANFKREDITAEVERLRQLLKSESNIWQAIEEFAVNKHGPRVVASRKLVDALSEVAHQTLQGKVNGNNPDTVSQAVKMELLSKKEQSI